MRVQKILGCVICAIVCATSYAEESGAMEDDKLVTKENVKCEEKEIGALTGLFGVKFGKVMSKDEHCGTNNIGELTYEYTPEKQFKDFVDYTIFATPITRQVSRISAVCYVDNDGVEEVFESAINSLEIKFKKIAIKRDSNAKIFFFVNGDYIIVTKKYKAVRIDACSNKLRDLTEEEVKQAEKQIYAIDIEALNLLPEMDDNCVYKIDAVLGQKFGDSFGGSEDIERMPDGYWTCEYRPKKRFMGCEDYRVFFTARTKMAFMVRAVYASGDTEMCYEHFRRVIEMATGRKMKRDDNGRDYHLQFGDALITLERDVILDKITLDFVRIKLYKQNETEQKEYKADIDAL